MTALDFVLTLSLCKGKLSLTLTGCPEAAPSPIIYVEIFIMSKTATITYVLPTTRTDGSALTTADIDYVDVQLSSDAGDSYTSVGHAPATTDAVQSFIQPELEDGEYLVQLIVVDKQVPPVLSTPVATPFTVTTGGTGVLAAASPVTGVNISLS